MYETVEHKGKEYRVLYQHWQDVEDKKTRAITNAYIKDGDNVIAKAIATCSMKDNFSKKKGRMIAKGRLIKVLKTL